MLNKMPRVMCLSTLLAVWMPPALASHLSQAEVDALQQACEEKRQALLGPERIAIIERCMRKGEGDQAQCTEIYQNYGERTTGAIRKLGKYYDLPECQQAWDAQKHFKMNPGR
jgi:hypothetical protein